MASPSLRLEELLADLERTERMLGMEREQLLGKEEELHSIVELLGHASRLLLLLAEERDHDAPDPHHGRNRSPA